MGFAHKTLSIMLVLGLVIGGIPVFLLAATQDASAATTVVPVKDESAYSMWNSNGYLYVDVSKFPDEGGEIISWYLMLIEYDVCWVNLNPLAPEGFGGTVRVHHADTIISDEKGRASYTFDIGNLCWTENAWLRGTASGWQNPEYFLGNMASRSLYLNLYTQPSGASGYSQQRGDTLGIVDEWYRMTYYLSTSDYPGYVDVAGSSLYAGSARMAVSVLPTFSGSGGISNNLVTSPTSQAGTINDYKILNPNPYLYSTTGGAYGTFTNEGIKLAGDSSSWIDGDWSGGNIVVRSSDQNNPNSYRIMQMPIYGPEMSVNVVSYTDLSYIRYQIRLDNMPIYPSGGGFAEGSAGATKFNISLPQTYKKYCDIEIVAYTTTSEDRTMRLQMIFPQRANFVLSDLSGVSSTTLNIINGYSVIVYPSDHLGSWQISGVSSTLTREDLVPVAAEIKGLYPLLISNPRWDKTPISDGVANGLKFDVYNLKGTNLTTAIYLSLIADDTTVWGTTVGQQSYPAWIDRSQFTTVHLTDVSIPAEPRREYLLRISSGGAVTEIPVVFYPPELDPDTVYGPKEDLDDIIDSFGTVNAAALQAYYNWAVSMEQRVVTIQSDVSNYTKLFSDRKALDNLESAKASADRAKEMIGELKTICKADPAGTNVGQLETLGKGIWDSYQAALLYREAAKGYEAGQDAWANSTALDAWYSDLTGRRIYTGWSDTGEYNDSGSSVVWVGVAVGLVVGALVSFFLWSQLAKHMPRGGSKAMKRAKMIAPIVIALVVGVIIAIGAYFLTVEIALGVQSWIAGLGLFLG